MLLLAEAKNDCFRNMTTQLYWEQTLWSGNKSVKIRHVNGGGTVLSPGVLCHMFMTIFNF